MRCLAVLCAALIALSPAAFAKGPNHCPPGLAKKTPACIPPGQVGKGTILERDSYRLLRNPGRYGLRPGDYAVFGDVLVRINKDTREVLDLIGAVDAILN